MTYKTERAHDSDVLRLDYERAEPDVGGLVGLCRQASVQVGSVSPKDGCEWRACANAAEQASEEREAYYQKRGMVDPTKKRGDSTPKRRKTEQDADGEVPAPREEVPLRDVPTCTFDHHSPQTQVYRLLRVSCPPSGTVILRV